MCICECAGLCSRVLVARLLVAIDAVSVLQPMERENIKC